MEITGGKIIRNETNVNAMGGSEIIATQIAQRVNPSLLEKFQIHNSRVRNIDKSKLQIFLAHDLPGDPESDILSNGGWEQFDKIVFVSNWQQQNYILHYNIPWHKCTVIKNAITPIMPNYEKQSDIIKLAYWSTPHRGLNILVPVFEALAEKWDNVELNVYSSFELYGWKERDAPYQELFDRCKNHPKIKYHGSVTNEKIRKDIPNYHILAYPNIWQETSCMVLMEAMSAGLYCIHPNYGALYETASDHTIMYPWNEDINDHAQLFYSILENTIINFYNRDFIPVLNDQINYAHKVFNWDRATAQWEALLTNILASQ